MTHPVTSPVAAARFNRDTFRQFRVLPWTVAGSAIHLHYALDNDVEFTETITLPVPVDVSLPGMSSAITLLAAVAGVSYFKVAAPGEIIVEAGPLTPAGLAYLSLLYDDGLREFAYRNDLGVPFRTIISLLANAGTLPASALAEAGPRPVLASTHAGTLRAADPLAEPILGAPGATGAAVSFPVSTGRPLLPMGGGRDSGLVASVLRPLNPLLVSVTPNPYVTGLAEFLGLEAIVVGRRLSPNIGDLNRTTALNGHIPVTAINSLICVVAALHLGCDRVILANEASASSPSVITAEGVAVNHQFSKSVIAERALTAALASQAVPISTFSAVRPWGELAIARAFATRPELFGRIMSCNRAFVRDTALRSAGWCGQCAKCRFVYLTLAPFSTPAALSAMFGRDLLASADPADSIGFEALLQTERPFDCVGEVGEAQLAVALLVSSQEWSDHAVVRALFPLVPRLDVTGMAASLAENPDHEVPADILTAMRAAFV